MQDAGAAEEAGSALPQESTRQSHVVDILRCSTEKDGKAPRLAAYTAMSSDEKNCARFLARVQWQDAAPSISDDAVGALSSLAVEVCTTVLATAAQVDASSVTRKRTAKVMETGGGGANPTAHITKEDIKTAIAELGLVRFTRALEQHDGDSNDEDGNDGDEDADETDDGEDHDGCKRVQLAMAFQERLPQEHHHDDT